MIIDLNVKIKTIKILEINIGENLCDLKLCKDFFGLTPKIQSIFLNDKFYYKRFKISALWKRLWEGKDKAKNWDTVFVNHILYLIKDLIHTSDKGLYL